jgi:hypothetical protein
MNNQTYTYRPTIAAIIFPFLVVGVIAGYGIYLVFQAGMIYLAWLPLILLILPLGGASKKLEVNPNEIIITNLYGTQRFAWSEITQWKRTEQKTGHQAYIWFKTQNGKQITIHRDAYNYDDKILRKLFGKNVKNQQ